MGNVWTNWFNRGCSRSKCWHWKRLLSMGVEPWRFSCRLQESDKCVDESTELKGFKASGVFTRSRGGKVSYYCCLSHIAVHTGCSCMKHVWLFQGPRELQPSWPEKLECCLFFYFVQFIQTAAGLQFNVSEGCFYLASGQKGPIWSFTQALIWE